MQFKTVNVIPGAVLSELFNEIIKHVLSTAILTAQSVRQFLLAIRFQRIYLKSALPCTGNGFGIIKHLKVLCFRNLEGWMLQMLKICMKMVG